MYFLIHHRFSQFVTVSSFSRRKRIFLKRKIIYKQNVREYDQFDLFYIYMTLFFLQNSMSFQKGIIYSAIQQESKISGEFLTAYLDG